MLRPYSPRLLLLLPTVTYRTVAFVEAARRLGVDVTVGSERPSTFERANPTGLITLDFADPAHAAAQARAFAYAHPPSPALRSCASRSPRRTRGGPPTTPAPSNPTHKETTDQPPKRKAPQP